MGCLAWNHTPTLITASRDCAVPYPGAKRPFNSFSIMDGHLYRFFSAEEVE
jgi:hypothetical protein